MIRGLKVGIDICFRDPRSDSQRDTVKNTCSLRKTGSACDVLKKPPLKQRSATGRAPHRCAARHLLLFVAKIL